MKTRSGFVSNSSSSSFLIVGKMMDFTDDEMKRILKSVYNVEVGEGDDLSDLFYETLGEDPEICFGWEPEYLGVPLSSFDDNNTIEEFSVDLPELVDIANKFATRFGFDIADIKVVGGEEST